MADEKYTLEVENKNFIKKVYPSEEAWKQGRSLIGGSTIGALLGLGRFNSSQEEYDRLINRICEVSGIEPIIKDNTPDTSFHRKEQAYQNAVMKYGHEHEKEVFDHIVAYNPLIQYYLSKGYEIKNAYHTPLDKPEIFFKKDCPYLSASIDGYIVLQKGDEKPIGLLVECKTHAYGKGVMEKVKVDENGNEVLDQNGENVMLKPFEYNSKPLDMEEYIGKHPDYIAQLSHYANVVKSEKIDIVGVVVGIEERNREFDNIDYEQEHCSNSGEKSYIDYYMLLNDENTKNNIKFIEKAEKKVLRMLNEDVKNNPEIFKDGWKPVDDWIKQNGFDYTTLKVSNQKQKDEGRP